MDTKFEKAMIKKAKSIDERAYKNSCHKKRYAKVFSKIKSKIASITKKAKNIVIIINEIVKNIENRYFFLLSPVESGKTNSPKDFSFCKKSKV